MSDRMGIGVGFTSSADGGTIARVVRLALVRAPTGAAATALHTSTRKSADASLRQAAQSLGLDLVFHDEAALATRDVEVLSRSGRVAAIVGVGSLAETAALLGAGRGARLVVPKFSVDGVSCAVAIAPEESA